MKNVYTTTSWGELDTRDVLTDIDEKTGSIIRAAVPSDHDLSMQALNAIRYNVAGVEFIKQPRASRHIVIGDNSFTRSKVYAKVALDGEYVWGLRHQPDDKLKGHISDIVRQSCLAAANAIGEQIAARVCDYRRSNFIPGNQPMTVRATELVRMFTEFGVEPPKQRVFSSMQTDETFLYLVSYYTIAPVGDDEYEPERSDV